MSDNCTCKASFKERQVYDPDCSIHAEQAALQRRIAELESELRKWREGRKAASAEYLQAQVSRRMSDGEETHRALEALRDLGWEVDLFSTRQISEIETAAAFTERLVVASQLIWEDDYRLVGSEQVFEGRVLSKEELVQLREVGVCVRLLVRYADPNADGLPVPDFASSRVLAMEQVNEAGFKAASEGMDFQAMVAEGDSSDKFWLTIAVPPEIARALRQAS